MTEQISEIHGEIKGMQIAGFSCRMFLPESYGTKTERYPVIYINGEIPMEEIILEVEKAGAAADFILLSIQPKSWNDDFTPWSAPAFRKGETPPQGKAEEYLHRMLEDIKPYVDTNYRTKPDPEHTVLLGYSLGGLAAIYSLYRSDCFGWIGSLSGSLWYDDFCEFMEKNKPLRTNVKVYLSLGKKESLSRNPRMKKVGECTEKARDILTAQLAGAEGEDGRGAGSVLLEWNEGGHFHDTAKRFVKAIEWWRGIRL